MSTSKQRALLAMLQDDMTTAQVVFTDANGRASQLYTYKVKKDWDVQKGDLLIVDSPQSGMTVVTVASVDKVPALDENATFTYKWAVSKIDRTAYDAQTARETTFLERLAEIDRLHKKLGMLEKVKTTLGVDTAASKAFDEALKELQS